MSDSRNNQVVYPPVVFENIEKEVVEQLRNGAKGTMDRYSRGARFPGAAKVERLRLWSNLTFELDDVSGSGIFIFVVGEGVDQRLGFVHWAVRNGETCIIAWEIGSFGELVLPQLPEGEEWI